MSVAPSTPESTVAERLADQDSRELRGETLVVCRDPETRAFLDKTFFVGSVSFCRVASPSEAWATLRESRFSMALVSIEAPESVEFIERLHEGEPDVTIAAISSAATPDLVRDVMSAGASDFYFGSLKSRTVLARLEKLRASTSGSEARRNAEVPSAEKAPSRRKAQAAESSEGDREAQEIICSNDKMLRVLEIAGKVAPADTTVLIEGESGTGKELLARYIHDRSPRAANEFIEVNCGAIPEHLLESQLFGHEKGSFTGAMNRQLGLFEVANRGTIFLDEIGEMSLDMQVKILRVLQAREFRRVGGSELIKVDVRVLAATNRDLKAEVEAGRFRRDLFFRLKVIGLRLPALRERRDEVPQLVEHFREKCIAVGHAEKQFAPEAIAKLQQFCWEGNIRELENAVERLMLLSRGEVVDVADIEEHLEEQEIDVEIDSEFAPTLTLDEVKALHIARVLRENEGNKMKSARILKINVKTLYNLIKSLEIKF